MDSVMSNTAYWKDRSDKNDYLWCECSNCGFMVENYKVVELGFSDTDYIGVKYNYCPKCGKKMFVNKKVALATLKKV